MHILDKIVSHKKKEVAIAKAQKSTSDLEKTIYFNRACNKLSNRLQLENECGIIAEFKRKSPSKQDINLNADLDKVTTGYINAGASAISILTDEFFFGGHNQYLSTVRKNLPDTPLLRKEFIIDEYQVLEAKSLGADIILLIAEILEPHQVNQLAQIAKELGMDVLLELHSESQLKKLSQHVSLIGVNNRDLTTFEVDYNRSKKLFDKLPQELPKIAESGLSEVETLVMLHQYGFKGFLIGERFMKHASPEKECEQLINEFINQIN